MEYKNVSRDTIAVVCPFCEKELPGGLFLTELYINKTSGFCSCNNRQCGWSGDFTEYAKNLGLTREEPNLKAAIADNGRQQIQIRPKVNFHLWSVSEILEHDFGEQDWIVKKLIPVEAVTILSGNPQNFKTWVTIEIARCVSMGTPFLGEFATTQAAVLIVDEEDHLRYLKKRLNILGVPSTVPIYYLSQNGVKVDDDKWLNTLMSMAEEYSIKLIIFDSFIRIHSSKENDAGEMSRVFDKIREFSKLGVAVLITHHHRKEFMGQRDPSQSIRGSSDIQAAVDCHLSLEKLDDYIAVTQSKLRVDEPIRPFKILINHSEDGSMSLEYGGELPGKEINKDKAKPVILDILKGGEHFLAELDPKITSVLPIGKQAIGMALKELQESKEILVRTGERNKKFYSLPNSSDDDGSV